MALVAWWKLADNLQDSKGPNDLSLSGSASYTTGKTGRCLQFEGGYAQTGDTMKPLNLYRGYSVSM